MKFGEVVQAPPQFQARPRDSKSKSARSGSLLLHQKVSPSLQKYFSKSQSRLPAVGLKRKQDLEIERERAISVYRERKRILKANVLNSV